MQRLVRNASGLQRADTGSLRVAINHSAPARAPAAAVAAAGVVRLPLPASRCRRVRPRRREKLRPQASKLNGEDAPRRGRSDRSDMESSEEIFSSSSSINNYSVAKSMEQVAKTAEAYVAPADATKVHLFAAGAKNLWGTVAYNYYNWRSGTGNDIIFFLTVVTVVTGLVSAAVYALDLSYGGQDISAWRATYEVIQLFFQDGFPDPEDVAEYKQMYSIVVATTGLVFFSILLALIEQLFLEVLESNVQRGSEVYEEGHYLVLSWMESALTLNAMWVVLRQICECHKPNGGTVVVVLSDESKVTIETAFQRFIPEDRRHGTKFVFRQGSPLIPDNLVRVAAKKAGSIIILSDAARAPEEADAQALRAAVLVDELYARGDKRGNVVVELKSGVSAQLLRSVCSEFVIPISTYNLNSVRLARLVQRPITAYVTNNTLDYGSGSQHKIHSFPEMVGIPFRQLKYFFPDATVMGLMNVKEGRCAWMPHDAVVSPGDEIFMLRDASIVHVDVRPYDRVYPDMSSEMDAALVSQSFDDRLRLLESDLPQLSNWDKLYKQAFSEEDEELSSANGDGTFSSQSALGSDPVLDQDPLEGSMEESKLSDLLERSDLYGQNADDELPTNMDAGIGSLANESSMSEMEQDEWDQIGSADERERQKIEKANVLIIGSAEDPFMAETIQEMDQGLQALRPGAQITLFNKHVPVEKGLDYRDICSCMGELKRISVDYIHGDPLNPKDLGGLPLESFNTVIILCDKGWLDPDMDSTNGIDARDTADMLRMDSMVMLVQVHIREILSRKNLRNVKIIAQKVAFEGSTRFEDPLKLPLGFTFNRKDFAARLLAQVACQPKILPIISAGAQGTNFEMRDPQLFLGPCSSLLVPLDDSDHATQGETMNYWALMERVEDYNEHLLGYVELPRNSDRALDIVINPKAVARNKKIAWGSRQLKLLTTSRRVETFAGEVSKKELQLAEAMEVACQKRKQRGGAAGADGTAGGRKGTNELERAMSDIRRRRGLSEEQEQIDMYSI